jgi:hypothetical protein
MTYTKYPKWFISRVKGALRAGLKPKQLAHWTGTPLETIKEWATDDRHAAVEADTSVIDDLKFALLKES